MIAKMRVGLALQPIATALFANSPFERGKPNGFKSYRAEIWRDTDPDRTGLLPFVFEDGMGFERYVDYALDVPMYFVYRNGRYIDVAGASFRDFMQAGLQQLPGVRPTFDDWADHLTTLFPDVRLKRFMEMRGADASSSLGGAYGHFRPFGSGFSTSPPLLAEASTLVADWSLSEIQALRDSVPRLGLEAPFRGDTALQFAREAVAIAEQGLMRRAQFSTKRRGRAQAFGAASRQRRRGPCAGGPVAGRIRRMIGVATSTVCSTLTPFEQRRGRLGESQSCVAGGAFATRRAYRGLCVRRTCARLRAHALALARRLGLGEPCPWARRFRRRQASAASARLSDPCRRGQAAAYLRWRPRRRTRLSSRRSRPLWSPRCSTCWCGGSSTRHTRLAPP